jgi:hypothetical protein
MLRTFLASTSTPANPQTIMPVALHLDRPDFDAYTRTDTSRRTTLLRGLVALAAHDGHVNPVEYDLLMQCLGGAQASAVDVHVVLTDVASPLPLPQVLESLKMAWQDASERDQRGAFQQAAPLLQLQGEVARSLAQKLAESLNLCLSAQELQVFEAGPEATLWSTVTGHSMRRLKGRQPLAVARDCVRLTGDAATTHALVAYLDGRAELPALQASAGQAMYKLQAALDTLERQPLLTAERQDASDIDVSRYREQVERMYEQIGQRLAMVRGRIEHEKQQFDEDVEECIHDAGNAVELDMRDRLRSDDWTAARVWESMGRTTLAKELERRVDRFARRHERQLGLMKEDLRLFQQDFALVRASVLQRRHHTEYRALMPELRTMTRVKNAVEGAADTAVTASVWAGLGSGAVLWAVGTAALPVVAPVAAVAAGTLVVAGVIKKMMDSEARKDGEQAHKREAFEATLRESLRQVRTTYFAQLDTVGREFRDTADALVTPLMLEAEAMARQATLQERVGRQVLAHARQEVLRLSRLD